MRMIPAIAIVALTTACSSTDAPPRAATPAPTGDAVSAQTPQLVAWLDEQFEDEIKALPERATSLGRKDNYDKLNDYTEAGQDRMLEWRRKSVAEMKSKFDRASLTADGQMYYDIWGLELERAERAHKYRRQNYVFGFNSSPHSGEPNFLISSHRVDDVADMEAYLSRLGEVGRVIDEALTRAKAASADGIRMPKFQYERVIAESQKLITGQPFSAAGPDSALWADAKKKIAKLSDGGGLAPDQAKALAERARKTMIETMKPAYERLIAWAKSDIGQSPSGKVGALTLPDGANWYATALFLQTTTSMTADEIHKLGLSEVERIHGEMDKLAQSAGFKDRKAFLADRDAKKDAVIPATDAGRAEYLKIANAEVARAREKLPAFFNNLPKYDTVVQREPAFSEVPGGAAHASRATPDGKRPGIVYVHLLTPTGFPRAKITDLMCHEGIPGHLMQGDVMVRQTGVPKFRTAYGYAAFGEGWGLYAEALCKEMGMYPDAASDYARLDGELWRAVRLVVDTGMHAMGWTEEEGVKYARENTTEDDSMIHAEIRRFLTYPGQACAYKIGQLTIARLRAESEKELGSKFDVRGFNDMVISAGSLPLSILETRTRAWAAAQKAPSATSAH